MPSRVRHISNVATLTGASETWDLENCTSAVFLSDEGGTSRSILQSSDGTNFVTTHSAPGGYTVLDPVARYVRVTVVGGAEIVQVDGVREIGS